MLDAGPFSDWLRAMRAVLRDEQGAAVPCGDCVGCCVSSYPIPLRPGDLVARQRVPEGFLLPVPGRSPENLLMGFREDGTCPFLDSRACTIYADRPQTCRDYDCRIFAATGLEPAGERPVIRERVRAWRFSYPGDADRAAQSAVQRAARFIRDQCAGFPPQLRAGQPTATAVLAIKCYEVFMAPERGSTSDLPPAAGIAAVLAAVRAFDRRG